MRRMLQLSALLFIFCLFLVGCASSDVSRNAVSNIDLGMQNAKNLVSGTSRISIADRYQNASQATKGALIGGLTGATIGALSSCVGIIPGTATGIILGGSYGSYIDCLTTLKDELANRGVNIIVLGDQILIVIPSSRLFKPYSPYLKNGAFSTLDLVAIYINRFVKIMVKIGGHTADLASCGLDKGLSKQQAEAVAKYLLLTGVDARLLYAEGYGATHLVTKNDSDWSSDNYRIEITLEKLYV